MVHVVVFFSDRTTRCFSKKWSIQEGYFFNPITRSQLCRHFFLEKNPHFLRRTYLGQDIFGFISLSSCSFTESYSSTHREKLVFFFYLFSTVSWFSSYHDRRSCITCVKSHQKPQSVRCEMSLHVDFVFADSPHHFHYPFLDISFSKMNRWIGSHIPSLKS